MKAYVTGSTGYLGTHLMKRLKADGHEAIALQTNFLFELINPDWIFHLAAQTDLEQAESYPSADLMSNVGPIINLLDYCRRQGFKPVVVFTGSVTQMGKRGLGPVDESAHDDPCTIYDLHKCFAEQYVRYYSMQHGIQGVTLRLSNVYGPGRSSTPSRGILNRAIEKAGKNLPIECYPSARYLRNYIYVDDVIDAFMLAALHAKDLAGGRFIVSSDDNLTIHEAFQKVIAITGSSSDLVDVMPEREWDIEERNYRPSSAYFRSLTGWAPKVSLEEGIRRTLDVVKSAAV